MNAIVQVRAGAVLGSDKDWVGGKTYLPKIYIEKWI